MQAFTDLQFEVLEDIACGCPVSQSLAKLVVLVESQVPGSKCAIYLVDQTTKTLSLLLAPNLPILADEALGSAPMGLERGSCGAALRLGQPVLVSALHEDELYKDCLPFLDSQGLKACWSTPIISQSPQDTGKIEVLGTFTVFLTQSNLPTEDYLPVLQRAQYLASLALETERLKKAESSVERQRELFMSAQSMVGLGSFEWEIATDRLTWSDILYQIYGVDKESFTPTLANFLSRVHPDDRGRMQETLEKALSTRSAFRNHERILRPDGSVRHLESFGKVDCDSEGNPTHVIGACLDVTDRKVMEKRLSETQKMEAVGRLAGGIAHDFNNLLMVINGQAALLSGGQLAQEEARDAISDILDAGRRAAELTSQLLAFSRGHTAEPTVLCLNEVVQGSIKLFERLVREGVQIIVELGEGDAFVKLDRNQLEQIVMNLLLNAADAMPEGGTLKVSTTSHIRIDDEDDGLKPGDYVELRVEDTGVGIEHNIIQNIFEPFFTTKEVGRGTGLGLAVVHGTVARWSGHIEVFSTPGQGTTFRVLFHRVVERPMEVKEDSEASAVKGQGTVLVVEDESSVRRLVSKVLEKQGYRVLEAENGNHALEVASAFSFELLLTDIAMPGMDGRELAHSFRERRPDLPIVFMSGHIQDRPEPESPNDNLTAYLQKPFSLQLLAQTIEEMFEKKSSQAP